MGQISKEISATSKPAEMFDEFFNFFGMLNFIKKKIERAFLLHISIKLIRMRSNSYSAQRVVIDMAHSL